MTASPKPTEAGMREQILAAAQELVRTEGIKALTQPRVAKLAGIRQSHLTYYFPRKADLFLALLEFSHAQIAGPVAKGSGDLKRLVPFLKALLLDRGRSYFFFGTVLEVCDEPELRAAVAEHARGLARFVAPFFGRQADDPAVIAFVDMLRGIALRRLLEPDAAPPDLARAAALLGLGER
jgi:AcrR family transcriptional regulator